VWILSALALVAAVLFTLGAGVYVAVTGIRAGKPLRLLAGVALLIVGGFGAFPLYLMASCFIWHECI
jgi:hypothetical protein